MSGIIAVYALVVAVLIAGNMKPPPQSYSLFQGFLHLACGLSVGMTGLAAGYAIGKVGDTVSPRKKEIGIPGYGEIECFMEAWADNVGILTGRASVYATEQDFRGHGVDSDFRGGAWTVWVSFLLKGCLPLVQLLLTSGCRRLIVALILNTRSSG